MITNLGVPAGAQDGYLLSIFGKMYECKLKFPTNQVKLNFVSNAKFNLILGNTGVKSEAKNRICMTELAPAEVERVCVNLKAEHKLESDQRLVRHAIETASSMGYKAIELGTGNSSVGQLALYQKCGFRIVGVDRDFFTIHYDEPIYENGIQCRDMVRLALSL